MAESSHQGKAVCDRQGRFVDTYVGWPGSVHDTRVLWHRPLYRQAICPPPGHFILADGGYLYLQHLLPLITSYKRPVLGVAAQRFNGTSFRGMRFEPVIGMMKTRFKTIFLQTLEVHHTFVPQAHKESWATFRAAKDCGLASSRKREKKAAFGGAFEF